VIPGTDTYSDLRPASDAGLAALRAERLRKASWSVVVSYLARGLAIVISFVSVPLTLNYLDKERYGLWLTISSIIAYLNVTDLGLGLGLQNRVAEARGRGEEEKIGELLSTAFSVMVVVGSLVALAGVAAAWLAPVEQWFHVSSPQVALELRGTLTVTALTFAYLLPVRMILSAQNGYQEAYLGGLWGIGGSIMSLVALLLVIAFKGNMVSLALASFLLAQLMNLANIWQFFRRHREASISWKKINLRLLHPLFSLGWQFFVINLYTLVLWNLDNLVIATQKGPEYVVPYAVAFRLVWTPLSLLTSIPGALWPAYTEAEARDDWTWIQSAYRRTTLLTVAIATLVAVIFWTWGQEFILVWVGPHAQGTVWMMTGLAVYLVLGQWSMCNGVLLNAIGWPRILLIEGLFDAAIKLGLSLVLIRVWDLAGVAWGTALASLFIPSWFLAWSIWMVTGKRVLPPWREAVKAVLLVGSVGLLSGFAMRNAIPTTWPHLLRVAIGGGLTAALSFLVMWFLVLPQGHRGELVKLFLSSMLSIRSGVDAVRMKAER
jgi:O-antigen/teichoic acid export membrane protein